jgi:SET domain-containing protein
VANTSNDARPESTGNSSNSLSSRKTAKHDFNKSQLRPKRSIATLQFRFPVSQNRSQCHLPEVTRSTPPDLRRVCNPGGQSGVDRYVDKCVEKLTCIRL